MSQEEAWNMECGECTLDDWAWMKIDYVKLEEMKGK